MKEDIRPYWVKKWWHRFRAWYVEIKLRPQFASLGKHYTFMKPWYVVVSGENIHMGESPTVVAEADQKVRIGVWGREQGQGAIYIGDAVMISPGTRISASDEIRIGDGVMFANGAYVTDSDWHGIYDRVERDPEPRPVCLKDNVWVGDHATVLKGVTVGENSVVAAHAVVTRDVPANVVVAGNPAKVVKELDPDRGFYTRTEYYANPAELEERFDRLDRMMLSKNSFWRWLKSLVWPD
jgi:acetyltransferase-like isoleucine patch superfamily enzyme